MRCLGSSVTRLGDFLHFGLPFKADCNNYFTQIAHIVRQFLYWYQNHSFFLWNYYFYRHLAIFIWSHCTEGSMRLLGRFLGNFRLSCSGKWPFLSIFRSFFPTSSTMDADLKATFDSCNTFNQKLSDTIKGLINANTDRKSEIDSLRGDHEDLKKAHESFQTSMERENDLRKNEIRLDDEDTLTDFSNSWLTV